MLRFFTYSILSYLSFTQRSVRETGSTKRSDKFWKCFFRTLKASFEKKKMIVNCLIKRVEISRGYKLKVEFNIDFEQFMVGIDKVA